MKTDKDKLLNEWLQGDDVYERMKDYSLTDEELTEWELQSSVDSFLRIQQDGVPEDMCQQIMKNAEVFNQAKKRSLKMPPILLWAAALLLIGGGLWFLNRPTATGSLQKLAAGWIVEGQSAEYTIISPGVVALEKGEIFVKSVPLESKNQTRIPLKIETQNAVVTAKGTDFYVGVHQENVNKTGEGKKMKSLTRVLVLSGLVTMANAYGQVEGKADSLLTARESEAPVKKVVKANSDFAVDLYKQLAKENSGENLFFSPYSISSVMSLLAEGMRGKSVGEMAKLMHFPLEATRRGNQDQLIPLNTSMLHSGFQQINNALNSQKSPEVLKLTKELADLRQQYNNIRKSITKKERDDVFDGGPENVKINKENQLAKQINELTKKVDFYELESANSLWVENAYKVKENYLNIVSKYYGDEAISMADFRGNPDNELIKINSWIENKTRGHFKDFLTKDMIDRETKLVIANAIYFNGKWKHPFWERRTIDSGNFTLIDGKQVKAPLMSAYFNDDVRYAAFNEDGSYFETPLKITRGSNTPVEPNKGGFMMVEMPYKGDEVSMIVIAPMEYSGLTRVEKLLSSENLQKWASKLDERVVFVKMPKYKLEANYSLIDSFKQMGFDLSTADLSGINKELFIDKVLHKSQIEVTEKGTEALALTVAITKTAAAKEVEYIPEFHADRPFIVLIRHRESGTVLFMGRVMNPSNK